MTDQTSDCDPVRATALTAAATIVAALCPGRPVSQDEAFTATLEGAALFEAILRGGHETAQEEEK
jgi:hypothetical protein